MDSRTIRISSIVTGPATYGWQVALSPELVGRFGDMVSLSGGRVRLTRTSGRKMNRPRGATMHFVTFSHSRLPDWPFASAAIKSRGPLYLRLNEVGSGAFDFRFSDLQTWAAECGPATAPPSAEPTGKLRMGVRAVVQNFNNSAVPKMNWQVSLTPELMSEFGDRRVLLSYGRLVVGHPAGILMNRPPLAKMFYGSFSMARLPDWPARPTMEMRARGTVWVTLRQTDTSGGFSFDTGELSPLFGDATNATGAVPAADVPCPGDGSPSYNSGSGSAIDILPVAAHDNAYSFPPLPVREPRGRWERAATSSGAGGTPTASTAARTAPAGG